MPIRGDMKYDVRIIQRNIRSGIISEQEYKKHIKTLKDLQSDSSPIEAELKRLDRHLPSAPQTDEDEL